MTEINTRFPSALDVDEHPVMDAESGRLELLDPELISASLLAFPDPVLIDPTDDITSSTAPLFADRTSTFIVHPLLDDEDLETKHSASLCHS